ncbi:MAG: zinc-ribbon domain-containing protein [Candidatus Micrarchaeaceae archaeon]|jgi:hypothetical protein
MNIDPDDIGIARKVLWPNETVEGTIKQRRIGPGGSMITPTSVVVTDKRLVIINRATLGFRQDYEVIPYNAITTVRLEHGIISSSVFIRVQGYDRDKGLLPGNKEEGEIDGLRNKDAVELTDYINKKIEERLDAQTEVDKEISGKVDAQGGAYIFCTKCGTKNDATSRFCIKCGAQLSTN